MSGRFGVGRMFLSSINIFRRKTILASLRPNPSPLRLQERGRVEAVSEGQDISGERKNMSKECVVH